MKKVCTIILLFTFSYSNSQSNWSNLNVIGFKNVVQGNNILVIEKAYVRDDGEISIREPADIGLHIFTNETGSWEVYKIARLFGTVNNGIDDDGSEKYEWEDNEGIIYQNFGIIPWENIKGTQIKILCREGDHGLTADDVVFEKVIEIALLKSGSTIEITGDCDIPEQCATLWFKTYTTVPVGLKLRNMQLKNQNFNKK